MPAPQIEFAYPVNWPVGRPRTDSSKRKPALFRYEGRPLLFDHAVRRLQEQAELFGLKAGFYRARELTLSTNFELRADGRPRRDRGTPSDPGVAFFFELDGKGILLACDRWATIADNIAAIAADIDAKRGQERWGVSTLHEAFAGHVALPAPEQWWQVLDLTVNAPAELIQRRYRELARKAHPDAGGSEAAMARLNAARDAGLRAAAGGAA
ncbi:MAG: hypothetical protein ABS48_01640 [Erythrobacter sp. SCN 68-10]|nr:MAG: hypothetical protein ABS48_01640 [Erythrobacter sp. SCN 68-10]